MKRALLLTALAPIGAVAQLASCPATLPEHSITVARAPAGWRASTSEAVPLDGGGMLSGDPKLQQYLVPAKSKKTKGGGSSTWQFEAHAEKWLYCTYGGMAVILSKRMDDNTTVCEASSRRDEVGGLVEITAVCR